MKKLIIILILITTKLFSQEYEIAWEKDIGGTYAQFSKDGEFIYVAGGNTISKYRSIDGSFVSTFDYGSNQVLAITHNFYLSKNDKYLITGSAIDKTNGFIYFWDTKTEKVIKRLNIGYSDFIDDNRMIITDYQHPATRLMIYDFQNEKILSSKSSNENFNLVRVSHNGKLIATASFSLDGSKYYLTLWDTETLTEIKRFELEGNNMTSFMDIKFSWDDLFVSTRRIVPYIISIFDTKKFQLYKELSTFMNVDIGFNEFMFNGDFVSYYPNPDISEYRLLIYNRNTIELLQSFNTKSFCLASSTNNLLFTGKYLLRPKNVGVNEIIQKINISNTKDIINIENKTEITEEINVMIFNLNGKEVYRNSIFLNSGTNKIQIPKIITNGSYIIQIKSVSIDFSQKILIQR
jgi:DNA-binding beta-propeller fold protein YncE